MLRQRTDIGLGQARLFERRAHAMLAGGLGAWAMVATVVLVLAVGQPMKSQLFGQRVELREQLRLAEVTTVGRVGGITRVMNFLRLDHLVPDADRAGQFDRFVQLPARQRWRIRRHSQRPISKHVVSHLGQQHAVHPTRHPNDQISHLCQDILEPLIPRLYI